MKRSDMINLIGDYLAIDGVVVKSDLYLEDIAEEIRMVIRPGEVE